MSILCKGCTCGHDHKTHRGEDVHYCLECSCDEHIPRCQNCGEEANFGARLTNLRLDACSRKCALQLEYATNREALCQS